MVHDVDSERRIQVGGDADTVSEFCAVCAARATVEARVVRAGVTRMTVVVDYQRPRIGPHAVQTSRAMVAFADGDITTGTGASIEEAILGALERSGKETA